MNSDIIHNSKLNEEELRSLAELRETLEPTSDLYKSLDKAITLAIWININID